MVGINQLRKNLDDVRRRVYERYLQYEMKKEDKQAGITIPSVTRKQFQAVLGWCTKAVDTLADRLVVREFKDKHWNINEIFKNNNQDTFFDSAILNSLIASCSFVYISLGKEGDVRLQVIEAFNATGIIDPITGLLKEGYAVLEKNEDGAPSIEAYFLPYKTIIIENGNEEEVQVFNHAVSYPLLIPIIHRPDATRPFGRSRISKSAEYYQKYAKSALERADITAEFYSFPQKYVTGLSQEAQTMDNWKATISSMLVFEQDENGNSPKLGQFTSPSMSPFVEQLKLAAAGFAGETGLTLDDLGFISDNPSSAEAIKASHENLRVMARKAQRSLTNGFKNVAYVAACLRDNTNYRRENIIDIELKWEPVFESDLSSISLIGDGAYKLNQAIPGFINEEVVRDLTGIKASEDRHKNIEKIDYIATEKEIEEDE